MDRWKGRVAVVSDVASGVGYVIAKSLAEHGMNVIGCAKDIKVIEDLSNELVMKDVSGRLIPMSVDLSKENEITSLFERIKQKVGHVDVCVNSAAICSASDLLDGETADWMNMFQINVIGKGLVTRQALKFMKEAGVNDGHIININSKYIVTSEQHMHDSSHENPHMYHASKEAAKHFTHGVRREVAKNEKCRIRITTIFVGKVYDPPQKTVHHNIDEKAEGVLTPNSIADTILYVLSTPSYLEITDITIKATGSTSY